MVLPPAATWVAENLQSRYTLSTVAEGALYQLFGYAAGGRAPFAPNSSVRIARALIQQPHTILLDEPTSNLDVRNQLIIIETIQELAEQGYTMVMTCHNPGHVFE